MSPINFDILRAEYPEYEAEWNALQEWFNRNWRKRYVELSVLLRTLSKFDRIRVILALQEMIDRGMLAATYRVKSPEGDLLEGDFDDPDQIPDELWARDSSHKISTAEGDLVSGYRWEPTDAA
jgi:hypothetical protein